MFTIVGLGNIGAEYANTRHNVGWLVLEHFLNVHGFKTPTHSGKVSGAFSEGRIGNDDVAVLFPHTYMNNSGGAVRKMLDGWTSFENLIVVHDDIALPLGDVRISVGRGSGGHNGVESIIKALGSKEFVRVRVGIAEKNIFGILKRPQGDALSKFVLGTFKKRNEATLEEIKKKVDESLVAIIESGIEKAMNLCNAK